MSSGHSQDGDGLGWRLSGAYTRTLLWYVLGVAALWVVGIESIYGSPTPFYALLRPGFDSMLAPGVVLVAMALGVILGAHYLGVGKVPQGRVLGVWALGSAFLVYGFLHEAHLENVSAFSLFLAQWRHIRWHLPALLVFAIFGVAFFTGLRRLNWFHEEPGRRAAAWLVVGLVVFAFAFSGAVAMVRDGLAGISQAYGRHGYEYVSDIGATGTIRALFRDYLKVRPYLSMHAKVHPPGPIALLWVFSYVVGRGALALSLATMLAGALAVVPLYFWAADLTSRRCALTCCALYSLTPSIVLFTATSADVLFTSFSLTTLFLFWRALHRRSIGYAVLAGAFYALLSLFSFSLLSLGAYFGFVGVWRLRQRQYRAAVIQTAAIMILALLAVHLLVRLWSGFDILACYQACRAQFELDQTNLNLLTPRFPSWAFKFLNPVCWFYFAGIPVSVLFVRRLARPQSDTKGLFLVFGLTLVALDVLYLGRGEGERSAMYIFPFLVLPAAHLLDELGRGIRSFSPLACTAVFMGFQCWLTESFLYTFW